MCVYIYIMYLYYIDISRHTIHQKTVGLDDDL